MLGFSRKGQAMIEFLPLLGIFIIVMSASLAFFRSLREGILRQEALRNLYFASTKNVGTLTSPPEFPGQSPILDLLRQPLIDRPVAINPMTPCYFITPGAAQVESPIKGIYLLENKITDAIQYRHYGVIRRLSGPPCRF